MAYNTWRLAPKHRLVIIPEEKKINYFNMMTFDFQNHEHWQSSNIDSEEIFWFEQHCSSYMRLSKERRRSPVKAGSI